MVQIHVHDETKQPAAARRGEPSLEEGRGSFRGLTGAVYEVGPVPLLEQFRLVAVLGELAENQTYRRMLFPLQMIRAINGEPVRRPASQLEIDALIQQVGEDYLPLRQFADSLVEASLQALKGQEKGGSV